MRFREFIESLAPEEYIGAVNLGRAREDRIKKAINKVYKVTPVTESEDMGGVDCFVEINKQKLSAQIQENMGELFVFQVIIGVHLGKVMKSPTQLYILKDHKNWIHFVKTQQLKALLKGAYEYYQTHGTNGKPTSIGEPIFYKGANFFVDKQFDNFKTGASQILVKIAPGELLALVDEIVSPIFYTGR